MIAFEQAHDSLGELIAWFEEKASDRDRNEASTRFHIVDRLLTECLGWPEDEIAVEEHHDGTYADYELGYPGKKLLIEAKRQGIYFELPAGFDKPTCRLQTLVDDGGGVADAIDQAMAYGQSRGIAVAAVCNGDQLVAFLASRQDGVPPDTGKALVFTSLRDMEERFRELWDCLSKPGIESRRIQRLLLADTIVLPPQKLSDRIVDYPGYKNRNPIATELQILGGMFIEDIARHPALEEDFLRETYCESGALSQYALVSREILRKRYSVFFEKEAEATVQSVRTKKGISQDLSDDIMAASLGRRPILLVGDVGVGKSMFIRHFIKVEGRQELERAIVLYLDFGSQPAVTTELNEYVISEVVRQVRDDYELDIYERNFVHGVYNLELERFATGVNADLKEADPTEYRRKEVEHLESLMGNPEHHLRACLEHASKGQKRQIVVFLDNVDQRPMAFQEEVFLIAQAFAQKWPVVAFITLRPDTFYRSRTMGSLSAYQPRVFTIDPPRVDRVVNKRLAFADKELGKKGRLPTFPEGLTVKSRTLRDYIAMLLDAFTNNQELIELVDNLSDGNVRRALDFVAVFVGSGHVDTEKILGAIEKRGRYTLPLHEFLRAMVFGDHEHYDPSDAPVINLFDISAHDAREHFLLLSLLAFVERMGKTGSTEGYVEVAAVYDFLQAQGFSPNQVQHALERARVGRLVTVPALPDGGVITRVRMTSAGAYSLKRLPAYFSYVDAVIVDTPIVYPSYRERVRDVRTIRERLDRAEVFIEYLDEVWQTVDVKSVGFDWSDVATELRGLMARIRERV
jgi:hypothetical protein